MLASPAGAPLTAEEIAELRARFALRTPADARRFLRELIHAPPWYARAIEATLSDQLNRPLVQDFLASLSTVDGFTAERLAHLAPPTSVLWGKSERVDMARSGLRFFQSALPAETRFEELDNVGHSPHFECPALLANRLCAACAARK